MCSSDLSNGETRSKAQGFSPTVRCSAHDHVSSPSKLPSRPDSLLKQDRNPCLFRVTSILVPARYLVSIRLEPVSSFNRLPPGILSQGMPITGKSVLQELPHLKTDIRRRHIGSASCRERASIRVVAVSVKKKSILHNPPSTRNHSIC